MDAKPQRPSQALQGSYARNNENNQPTTLTQLRNKSAGNLKTMVAAGPLNVAPKRTVFGDVSNMAKGSKDGLVKDGAKNRVKSVASAVMLRDAKADKENGRNLAKMTSQGKHALAASAHTSASLIPFNKPMRSTQHISHQTSHPISHAVIKQGVFKKTTVVYQDQKDLAPAQRPEISSTAENSAALDKQIKNPRQYRSQPYLKGEQQQPALRWTQSRYMPRHEQLPEYDDEHEDDNYATDATYEDALDVMPSETDNQVEEESHKAVIVPSHRTLRAGPDAETAASTHQAKALPAPPAAAELEDWDGEEDDDQYEYEEQGYTTTTQLYRSQGENTIGGATTMVVPKVTMNTKKELEMAKAWVTENQTEEEMEEEAWDVSMVAEYGDEIFEYMRSLETHLLPSAHYMDIQSEIQWSMRSVLMDWLVQVHLRFNLLPETLFLTVNYIDRFLSVKVVSLGKLQLVGATAIFLAAKYEEINCPSVQEIVFMVDSGYTVEEILKAERFMLSMLQFELGWPGPMSFLRRISKADDYELETRTLAKYFLEVTIMDERFVGCPPSYVAAGAHCLARMILNKGDWSLAHVHYSGYTFAQIKSLVTMIYGCCQEPRKHHLAVYHKYESPKYKRASVFVAEQIRNGFTLPYLSGVVPSQYPGVSAPSTTMDEESRHMMEYRRTSVVVSG